LATVDRAVHLDVEVMTQGAHSLTVDPAAADARTAPLVLREWAGPDAPVGLERWRSLEQRLGNVPLAGSHLWTSTWLKTYSTLIPSRIVTAESSGQTVAACLVTEGTGQKSGPVPLRTWHIGTAGEPHGESVCVEYNDLLCEPSRRAEFIGALRGSLATAGGFDEFRLDGWTASDLPEWNLPEPRTVVTTRESRYFDLCSLRDSGGEPIDRLGRSTRQNLRRLLRKYGELEATWAKDCDEADEIFEELVSLHQARWKSAGQPGAFASVRFKTFQRSLMIRGVMERKVVLFRVRHEGATVGCLMLLVDRNRLLDYVSGFASFEEKPSPGLVTHFLCLSEAARRGFDAYDFLVGDKRHKENLSTDSRHLAWAAWRRPTWRNTLIDALKRLKPLLARTRGNNRPESQPTSETTTPDADRHAPLEHEAAAKP
jgi:CelD/BcsL family acetyltransferase involved in cellulose biosynthesis